MYIKILERVGRCLGPVQVRHSKYPLLLVTSRKQDSYSVGSLDLKCNLLAELFILKTGSVPL